MKKTIVALMITLAVTSPVYAEAPTYINTVTGLTIPVYPDWKQETINSETVQCTPAFDGGFFQIMDRQLAEPIDDKRIDFSYYTLEKQEDEDEMYDLINVRNDEILGKDVAYTDMFVNYNGVSYYGRKLHFINKGNLTIVTMLCSVSKFTQFETEFDNWINTFTLSE